MRDARGHADAAASAMMPGEITSGFDKPPRPLVLADRIGVSAWRKRVPTTPTPTPGTPSTSAVPLL
ncbi:hypothetical protein [Micromonospora sp. NPDC051296]|uniref:hypothetical protein n=1 Tax=Micromonospora sp. NPDC051296 TaxID=3155046 RepID=UPI0034437974